MKHKELRISLNNIQFFQDPNGELYEIESIGEGGCGCVYKLTHTSTKKLYSLKIFYPSKNIQKKDQTEIEERIKKEILFLKKMKDKDMASHVVEIYSYGYIYLKHIPRKGFFLVKDQKKANTFCGYKEDEIKDKEPYKYLMMEYYEYNLHQFCREMGDKIDSKNKLNIAIQIAEGIKSIHNYDNKKVFHRDIKPSNILIEYKNKVPKAKIADFGIAHIDPSFFTSIITSLDYFELQEDFKTVMQPIQQLASPEQLENTTIDYRTDIFSFGATIHFLFTLQYVVCRGEYKNYETTGIEKLDLIIKKMMEKSPHARQQDIEEIIKDLKDIDSEM